MALDDDGMKNQYLTKLRVKIREDSDIMRELTEMLQDFALSYNAELNSAGNVDQYNPRAQEFLEAWEALRQDFDVWVGQISFADVLELQAMWNNREIWPRRLARLPSIAIEFDCHTAHSLSAIRNSAVTIEAIAAPRPRAGDSLMDTAACWSSPRPPRRARTGACRAAGCRGRARIRSFAHAR